MKDYLSQLKRGSIVSVMRIPTSTNNAKIVYRKVWYVYRDKRTIACDDGITYNFSRILSVHNYT